MDLPSNAARIEELESELSGVKTSQLRLQAQFHECGVQVGREEGGLAERE